MNVSFACSECGCSNRVDIDPTTTAVVCKQCGLRLTVPDGAVVGDQVHRCLICPGQELYVRKDFSQRAGVRIVFGAAIVSCIFWAFHLKYWAFGVLFAVAALDFFLYLFRGNMLQCYRCQSEYRGTADVADHQPFSLETHERYRQQAARLEKP